MKSTNGTMLLLWALGKGEGGMIWGYGESRERESLRPMDTGEGFGRQECVWNTMRIAVTIFCGYVVGNSPAAS